MSTNLLDWSLIPPNETNPYFGFDFTGPAGSEAFMRLFVPDAGIDLLSSLADKELTVEDLAIYLDDDQASMTITELDTGIEVFVYVKFTDDKVAVTPAEASETVSKTVTLREQANVSLTAKQQSLSKGQSTKLFGWIKNGKANQTIKIKRKLSGEDRFAVVDEVKTDEDGYYKYKISPKKTATYLVVYKTKQSKKVKVTITN